MPRTRIEEIAMPLTLTTDQLTDYIGKEVGVSDWMLIDQERINQFAEATGDHQYIHVDPERARKHLSERQSPMVSDDVPDG